MSISGYNGCVQVRWSYGLYG